ncbi:FAD-dependent oxidoreductase [Dongia sp.]|uniref:GcvT family protein n=1 Tax=Dongia sp. TaxID=1977262 RepID=UPI0035B227AA
MTGRQHAEILIIGAGIIGCSIAYHLARMGKKDVVILEKSGITHGATWHAAGLVGQLRSSRNVTRMLRHSVELYDQLEAETGMAIDWKKYGSLRLACSSEREMENKRSLTMAKSFGLEMQELSPGEAQDLFPIMSIEDVRSAVYIPSDGYIDPSGVCQALAKGAKDRGARIVIGERVTGMTVENRRVGVVKTDRGEWSCDLVVNCAGMWGHEIGEMAGIRVPSFAVEHQYLITDPLPDVPKRMPTMRDPDHLVYYKPEVRGLVIGGYEPNTLPFAPGGIPKHFAQELLPGNFERFEMLAKLGGKRTPIINTVGVRELINGPIPYSADSDFVMGKSPELDNYFVSAGFLYGIAAGGGAGRMMAEWIVDGSPSLNLWPLDVRRFSFHHNTRHFMYPRAVELYGHHYKLHRPGDEHETMRGIRRSPLYEVLKARGAVFGSRGGWERPNWFAPTGLKAADEPAFDRARTNWFDHVGAEHEAVRNGVALIDQTSFAKYEILGGGALTALQKLAVSDMDKPVGSTVYTQLCNSKGGIECDLTFSRLTPDRFYFVTGSAFGLHDRQWIESHLPRDGSVQIVDMTSARAVINICGPKSRDVLAAVVEEDVSNAAFPFSTCRQITVGAAPVLAIRIGYVGELGWELHVPTEYAAHVYEVLREAGETHGVRDVGYRAIDSLRMEKGYLYWSSDITPDYSPYEAGLGFRVNLKKGDFIGRDALAKQKADGIKQKLCSFTLDKPLPLYGGEAVIHEGKVVGVTTSGNFSYTSGKSVAYAYLPSELSVVQGFTVESFTEQSPATRHDGPLYDPKNERLKA